ncbi:hypothetical protein PHMEG_00025103 [Phytophthora megakarya]|uniref:RING-type domain-containing protein n=1 Tax=Phytophthora megakarya TaxID=4795 RepID=A0A225VEA2_9STRA|nr:hypothetical protein PHMEG_00025103 [Phytophthora megakarya]
MVDTGPNFIYVGLAHEAAYSLPSRLPKFSERHIRWHSVDSLRYYVQQELPLLVEISSATKKNNFVVYNCSWSSVASKNTWTVSYRYSEFVDFRTKLDDQWTCHDAKCPGSCQAIRDIVSTYFPKKRLAINSASAGAITSRKNKFEFVLTHLLRSVLLPGSAMKCMHAREHLPDNVFEFLGVKDPADKRSLLQIFVDNYQLVVAEKKNQSDVRDNKQPNEVVGNSTQCTICLTNVEMNTEHQHEGSEKTATDSYDAPIILPCNHSFHRKCIFQWLQFEFHCPVCRVEICSNGFTNNCRPNRHVQWWLSDFEEDILLASTNQDDANTIRCTSSC